jgi:prepilin-type N-terminal cleavage/methylation domain-containing protein
MIYKHPLSCFKLSVLGFTLIELLVVVLIIGILAAIALPQYRLAVAKSEMSQGLIIGKALRNAVIHYHLIHGQYPCKDKATGTMPVSTDKLDITFTFDENGITKDGKWKAFYNNCQEIELRSQKKYLLNLRFQFRAGGVWGNTSIICHNRDKDDFPLGEKICLSLGGTFLNYNGENSYYRL